MSDGFNKPVALFFFSITMKKSKDNTPDIYEDIDRFLCHGMNSSEEKKFLDRISKDTKNHDKVTLCALMIKVILNKGKKAESELLESILHGHKEG